MTKRRTISKAMRIRVFDAAGGVCHLCKLPIKVGEAWEVDHEKPLWMSGQDIETNMRPAHVDCHATKSKGDAAPKAKTDRQRANLIGVSSPPAKPIQSRGFAKKEDKPEKPTLPPRRLYK